MQQPRLALEEGWRLEMSQIPTNLLPAIRISAVTDEGCGQRERGPERVLTPTVPLLPSLVAVDWRVRLFTALQGIR
jgi:hypothetical protein